MPNRAETEGKSDLPARIRAHPLACLAGFGAITLLALLAVPPISQSQIYHDFADARTVLGLPNFWNVVSNLPFLLVGALGLWTVRRDPSVRLFFAGVFLTGFSSSYYHLHPDDAHLFWDRLPMTVAFMAILANVIGERIDARAGRLSLWPLIALGFVSLIVWLATGDLRLYGWVQFFPCVALPLMFLLLPPKYGGTGYWFAAAGFYLLAKLFELFDAEVYSALRIMSGHPLKHLAAAGACFMIYLAFRKRQPAGVRITEVRS
jgi:hypothetical protein